MATVTKKPRKFLSKRHGSESLPPPAAQAPDPIEDEHSIYRGALEIFLIKRGLKLPREGQRPFWMPDLS